MSPELIHYFATYGLKALFVLIFLQEIGIPNPIPNELVLFFSGYLIFRGTLNFFSAWSIAASADFIGTNLLYFIFYFFGAYILAHKPSWLPISDRTIRILKIKIAKKGRPLIFIGRLTPFLRGYTSVITGLLQVRPFVFLPLATVSALIWSGFYITAGILSGPFWKKTEPVLKEFTGWSIAVVAVIIVFFLVRYLVGRLILKDEK